MNILITGGTGYFGRAFAAWAESRCEKVVIYSRDEVKQWSIRQVNPSEKLRFMIGDVRDLPRLTRAMYGIDYVVHAAALKRIEVGHYNPDEMVKTNVIGTMNVIDAAIQNNVSRVVTLSSDKAFSPVSTYGCTKALAEQLTLNANNITGQQGPTFAVTRYGNVAGSTGSVIPAWRNQHARGQKVTITDPECTRFWMSRREAVDLVWATIMGGVRTRLAIPTLPAFRLGDLAEAMGVESTVVGLPAHEKLHESMQEGQSSEFARRMSVEEIKERLEEL